MATKQQQIEFVKTVYAAAKKLHDKNPAETLNPIFVTAQAALETGFKIGGIENNLFGITKGSNWTGKTKLCLTTEYFKTDNVNFTLPEKIMTVTKVSENKFKYSVYRLFRIYDKLEDCLDDHLSILKKSGYADAWAYRDNPREYAKRLVDSTGAKYATATNYVEVLHSFIASVENIIRVNNF
jgi:flagellar protein FlgJ